MPATLIHPLVVHFPVALWLTSVLFDLLYLRTGDGFYARASRLLIGLGLLGALVSIITGFMDFRPLVAEGVGQLFKDRHRTHSITAFAATIVFLVSFLLRWRRPALSRGMLVALLTAGAALIAVTGWLGGEVRMAM